jgi:Glycosyl transferase 4-like domain
MAKYLGNYGWRPTVIRADERHYTERLDPALAGLVPDYVTQLRTSAFPANLARMFNVGDIGLRAYFPMQGTIKAAIQKERPDVIFITGSPYYPLLLSGWIKKTYGIPVILDFQDPWVSAEGALRPKLSKGGLSHRLATMLEPMAVRHASFITSVSDRQNDEMATRYPWLDRTRMAAVPIGGDPEDFDALRRNPPSNPQFKLEPGRIHLSYVGTFLPKAGPLVRTLFDALADLRREHPALAERLQLNFVGTSNQPAGGGAHLVSPIAEAADVGDLVREHPPRVPFLEALSILASSNGLLIIGSDEPHYTASKIYPGLMSGTPFLSLFHSASSAHHILSEAGGGLAYGFETLDGLAALRPALAQGLAQLVEAPASLGSANPQAYEAFTASNVAGRYAEIFEQVSQK